MANINYTTGNQLKKKNLMRHIDVKKQHKTNWEILQYSCYFPLARIVLFHILTVHVASMNVFE